MTGVGQRPTDAPEIRLQKALLTASTLMMASLAILWGAIYAAFGEWLAAAIPWAYTAVSFLSIVVFAATKRYALFRFSQLLLSLVLPAALMLTLGGFVPGSAVVLWSLTSPLGALLFAGPREALRWFVAFLALVAICVAAEATAPGSNDMPPASVAALSALNVLGVSTVVFVLTQHFVRQQDRTLRLLGREQRRSRDLLLNVLPQEIATRLMDGHQTIAQRHDAASVLFADLVGFTQLSASLSASDLTRLLNELFSRFDGMVAARGLEKIRTIGDAYMVASGVPAGRADHAQALADLALEMLDFSNRFEWQGRRLSLRIGMASGPVTAGVMGHLKFCYDVWGDTVNLASRMTTQGDAGRIQLAEGAALLLADTHLCAPRGVLDVKGRGPMRTYFLLERRAVLPQAVAG